MMATLEHKIKEKAGIISEAMLVGPEDEDKAPDLEVVETAEKPAAKKK